MRKLRAITPKKCCHLWGVYATFRQPQIAPSTFKRDYLKISRRLEKMHQSAPHLETTIEIRDWLLKHYAAETARRTLVQLQACGRWAMESGYLPTNPFEGLPRHIRPTRPSEKAWAAFSLQERDRIIQEFEATDSFYASWVKFLFWTGCRPEEAVALKWESIATDFTEILFFEALPTDVKVAQPTKNGKTTRFPCNNRLQNLLRSMQPTPQDRSRYVFLGVEGNRLDYRNFQTRHWKPLVRRLVEQGKIAFYLSQYHCRHTWITEALNHLSVADVSYLARVSATVLYQHYAGRSRRIIIPEF
ncbi:MAG: tyrosine-type recombinase/integrase [Cyanothece sp. SIO1E1]|nr:tyrosine-type recombinase/integrase [Cyanothece sp. SIO1E1]